MILTTTNSIQGKDITHYLGIVTATVYVKIYKTKGLSFKDSFNMEKIYESAEDGLEQAKKEALDRISKKSQELQGNAVVGITMDVEIVRESITVGISVMGTAVSYK